MVAFSGTYGSKVTPLSPCDAGGGWKLKRFFPIYNSICNIFIVKIGLPKNVSIVSFMICMEVTGFSTQKILILHNPISYSCPSNYNGASFNLKNSLQQTCLLSVVHHVRIIPGKIVVC